MTQQEHELMIGMLARLAQDIEVLVQILRSRDVLTDDDQRAFRNLVHEDAKMQIRTLYAVHTDYMKLARSLQVQVTEGPAQPEE